MPRLGQRPGEFHHPRLRGAHLGEKVPRDEKHPHEFNTEARSHGVTRRACGPPAFGGPDESDKTPEYKWL